VLSLLDKRRQQQDAELAACTFTPTLIATHPHYPPPLPLLRSGNPTPEKKFHKPDLGSKDSDFQSHDPNAKVSASFVGSPGGFRKSQLTS